MKIGIIGAGQLGRMLALAGYPLALQFRFLDAHADSPGGGTSAARPMSLVTATSVSATAPASVDQRLILIAPAPVRYFHA